MKRLSSGTKRKKAAPARLRVSRVSKTKKSAPARKVTKKAKPVRRSAKSPQAKTGPKRKAKAVKAAKPKLAKKTAPLQKPSPSVGRATPKHSAKRKISAAVVSVRAKRKPPTKLAGRITTVQPVNVGQPKALLHRNQPNSTRRAVTVPAFLLEGDEPSVHTSGLGEKFSLGPTPPLDHFDEANATLPESYGTGKIYLTARDPHWLYANWDFTREEQFRHNAASVDRHLVLRIHLAPAVEAPLAEYHVHPESKHWFVHVERAGTAYVTELGYYATSRQWKSLGFSAPQCTPPDNISKDATVKFATIPMELPFDTMLQLLRAADGPTATHQPLAYAVDRLRPLATEYFPKPGNGTWSDERGAALEAVLAADTVRNASPSSGEFTPDRSWPEFFMDWQENTGISLNVASSYVSSYLGGS